MQAQVSTAMPLTAPAPARGVTWLSYLPEKSLLTFAAELRELSKVLEVSRDWKLLDQFLFEWEETAMVYTDPVLLAQLSNPSGEDLGPAPRP